MREVAIWEERLEAQEVPDPESRKKFPAEELLPCHYFDYMYGTSTGGLIATMLGRLRMSVDKCLKEYREVGEDLFGHKRSVMPLTTKYHHEPLEKAVRRIVRENCPVHKGECDGKDWHPWDMEALTEDMAHRADSSDRICQR